MWLPSQANRSRDVEADDQGLEQSTEPRPIQLRVPDVRSAAFLEEARRQSLAVANSPEAEQDQAFIDAISTWGKD